MKTQKAKPTVEPDSIDSRKMTVADKKKMEHLISVHKKKQKKSNKRAA